MARTRRRTEPLTPVGETEIAQLIRNADTHKCVSRGTIAVWRHQRDRDTFPQPAFRVGGSPCWFFETIEAWFNDSVHASTCYIDTEALAERRSAIAEAAAVAAAA